MEFMAGVEREVWRKKKLGRSHPKHLRNRKFANCLLKRPPRAPCSNLRDVVGYKLSFVFLVSTVKPETDLTPAVLVKRRLSPEPRSPDRVRLASPPLRPESNPACLTRRPLWDSDISYDLRCLEWCMPPSAWWEQTRRCPRPVRIADPERSVPTVDLPARMAPRRTFGPRCSMALPMGSACPRRIFWC